MTNDDYKAASINAFANLENLLKTRRDALSNIAFITGEEQRKFKLVRARFNNAILAEILVSEQIQVKPKMTAEQHLLWKFFHNSLCDLEAHISHYLANHGRDNYLDMINNIRERGFALLADYKNQFVDV